MMRLLETEGTSTACIPNVASFRNIKLERNIKWRVTSVRSSRERRISRGPS